MRTYYLFAITAVLWRWEDMYSTSVKHNWNFFIIIMFIKKFSDFILWNTYNLIIYQVFIKYSQIITLRVYYFLGIDKNVLSLRMLFTDTYPLITLLHWCFLMLSIYILLRSTHHTATNTKTVLPTEYLSHFS